MISIAVSQTSRPTITNTVEIASRIVIILSSCNIKVVAYGNRCVGLA